MTRSDRPKFRPLLAALLALAVLASPLMSAQACARTCAAGHDQPAVAANDGHKCCATKHSSEKQPSKKSDQRDDCTQCAAACCRPVSTVDQARAPIAGEALALSVEPAPVLVHDFVGQKLIFHPPRA